MALTWWRLYLQVDAKIHVQTWCVQNRPGCSFGDILKTCIEVLMGFYGYYSLNLKSPWSHPEVCGSEVLDQHITVPFETLWMRSKSKAPWINGTRPEMRWAWPPNRPYRPRAPRETAVVQVFSSKTSEPWCLWRMWMFDMMFSSLGLWYCLDAHSPQLLYMFVL